MKKSMLVVLALLLVLSLTGCGAGSKPETVVVSFCDSLKTFDAVAAAKCMVSGEPGIEDPYAAGAEAEEGLSSQQAVDFLKSCAAKMTYTVGESQTDGDSALVPVSFSYVDASPVASAAISDYISQAFALALSGADQSALDELFGTIFVEKTASVETVTATSDVQFECTRTEDGWKIADLSEENKDILANIMACNITSAFEGLDDGESDEAFGEDTVWHDVPLGQELELATIKICVTGCEELTELTADYLEPAVAQEGTKFVVFSVDIENITKDTLSFNNDLSLTDSQERKYEPFTDALWYFDQTFSYADLAPNIKQSGVFVYNVPADSESYFLSVAKSGTNDAYRLLGK